MNKAYIKGPFLFDSKNLNDAMLPEWKDKPQNIVSLKCPPVMCYDIVTKGRA